MLYLVFFVLLFSILIFLSKVFLNIDYHFKGLNKFSLEIYATLYIVKLKVIKLPVHIIDQDGTKVKIFKKMGKKKEEERDKKKFSLNNFSEQFKKLITAYYYQKGIIGKMGTYLGEKLCINKLLINIELGTGDVFSTAIVSGMTWSIVGVITSFLENQYIVLNKQIDIQTIYDDRRIRIDFCCILHVKFVHIIVVLIKSLLHAVKEKNDKK